RNSVHSWAARVLLWASTRVGRLHWAMTLAMVKVLPLPVTPSKVWHRSPRRTPCTSFSMASGWSPVGWYGDASLKRFSSVGMILPLCGAFYNQWLLSAFRLYHIQFPLYSPCLRLQRAEGSFPSPSR